MKILKSLVLLGAVLIAAPAAAHTYVYDDGDLRVSYQPDYGYYTRHYYDEPYYEYRYRGHSQRRHYQRDHRYHRHHVRRHHRHHHDCDHGRRHRH